MTSKIYSLSDPTTGEIRYVGKTKHKLDRRLRQHLSRSIAGGPQHVNKWIRLLQVNNISPVIELIEEVEDWQTAERTWISYFITNGANLTNIDPGGGCITMSQDICNRISETRKRKKLGPSALCIENSLKTRAKRWKDPQFRLERATATSISQKELWRDPTHRAKMLEARKLGWKTRREHQLLMKDEMTLGPSAENPTMSNP